MSKESIMVKVEEIEWVQFETDPIELGPGVILYIMPDGIGKTVKLHVDGETLFMFTYYGNGINEFGTLINSSLRTLVYMDVEIYFNGPSSKPF